MKDYAKINTQEQFNWLEALISVLLLPGVLIYIFVLKMALQVLA